MHLARLLACLVLFTGFAAAQFTTVSGTVTDPNGLPYTNGTITATLVLPGGISPTLGGGPYSPPSQAVGLDLSGSFTMQLADNTVLLPASTTWTFLVCSAAGTVQPAGGKGPVCFTAGPLTISGISESITSTLTATALPLASGGSGVISSPIVIPRSLANTGSTVFGDSVGLGSGASSFQRSYAYLVSNSMLWTLTNNSVSGTQLADSGQTNTMLASSVTAASLFYFITGYNDMRYYGTGAGLTTYNHTLQADLVWLALPAASKVMASNAAVTKTGTWAGNAQFGQTFEYSGNPGDSLSWTSPAATAVYIASLSYNLTNPAVSVTVDGSACVTGFTEPTAVATQQGQNYGLYLIRCGGLANTSHSVVFTRGAGANNVFVLYFASNVGMTSTGPYVFLGNCLSMNAAGYAAGAPFNNGSNAAVAQINSGIASVARTLAGDGLQIRYVDVSSAYTPNVAIDVYSDNIHPSDAGHVQIANAFLANGPLANGSVYYNGASLRGGSGVDDWMGQFVPPSTAGGANFIATRNVRHLMVDSFESSSLLTTAPEFIAPTALTGGWRECFGQSSSGNLDTCTGYGQNYSLDYLMPSAGWYSWFSGASFPNNDAGAGGTIPDTHSIAALANNGMWISKAGYSTQLVGTAAITGPVPVKADTSNGNQVVVTTTSDTGAGLPIGVCVNSPGIGKNCSVMTSGVAALTLGTGTCAIGNFVIVDTTTNGRVKCTGTYSAGTVIGVALTAQSSVGSSFNVMVGLR